MQSTRRYIATALGPFSTLDPFCKVKSMDDNCGEWVECMGVASGSGWNLWVWLLGMVVRRYIDFLILLIPTPLVCSSTPLVCSSTFL